MALILANGGANLDLPAMPDSQSNYLTLTSASTDIWNGKNCGIKNPTTIHALRTSASSAITVYYYKLYKDGSISRESVAISANNTWVDKTDDFSNVYACCFALTGTLGSGEIHIYFE